MIGFAILQLAIIVPLAIIFLRPPPEIEHESTAAAAGGARPTVLGWHPNVVFVMIALAGFLCCVTMSMPQQHLVAYCSDLGISATVGATMLSVLLGMGFFSRQGWGWLSDRMGGVLTAFCSSILQCAGDERIPVHAGRRRPVRGLDRVRARLQRAHSRPTC